MSDVFTSYETGLAWLLEWLGKKHKRYTEALTLQSRLLESIAQARLHGDTGELKPSILVPIPTSTPTPTLASTLTPSSSSTPVPLPSPTSVPISPTAFPVATPTSVATASYELSQPSGVTLPFVVVVLLGVIILVLLVVVIFLVRRQRRS